jgi:tRNA (guanine-N7-)-methyltransferase
VREFNPTLVPEPLSPTAFPLGQEWVDLEIGCGVGFHPIRYAQEHSERTLIAIERTNMRFARFQSRLAGHPHVTNVVPIQDDAIRWVTHRVPPGSLDRIFLLYPNPYPKSGQQNKRWHSMPFMGHLLGCLTAGGTLTLATNMASYAEEARQMMQEVWGAHLIQDLRFTAKERSLDKASTHFERKYLQRGEGCTELVFQTSS